jgi:hypothetical protein
MRQECAEPVRPEPAYEVLAVLCCNSARHCTETLQWTSVTATVCELSCSLFVLPFLA